MSRQSGSDLEIGDTTDPYVPAQLPPPPPRDETQIFARPSSQYPLAVVDDDGATEPPTARDPWSDPTTVYDRDELPTMRGRAARTIDLDEMTTARAPSTGSIAKLRMVKRSVPPPFSPGRERRVTPVPGTAWPIRKFR